MAFRSVPMRARPGLVRDWSELARDWSGLARDWSGLVRTVQGVKVTGSLAAWAPVGGTWRVFRANSRTSL